MSTNNAMTLKIPPLLLMVITAVAMAALAELLPFLTVAFAYSTVAGGALMALGAVIAIVGVAAFRSAKTTVDPRYPENSQALVDTGIYQFSRNPMYVGFLVVLAGWAVVLSNVACLILLPAFVVYLNVFQIAPEEKALLASFGPRYSEYCSRVRRWL